MSQNDPGACAPPSVTPIGGGTGPNVAAWSRPDLVIGAPGGIAMTTPAHHVVSAGQTATLAAGQDINLLSQRHLSVAFQGGLSLFTYGRATNPGKPNTETGLQLHAACGNVSLQAQANTVSLAADQAIDVHSTTDAVTMASPTHVLLTAGGASLRIQNGNITLTTRGRADFLAAMKELTGAAGAQASQRLPSPAPLPGCAQQMQQAMQQQAALVPLG